MNEKELSQIIEVLNRMQAHLVTAGEADEEGISPSYNVAKGLVMIAEAIDRNTAAIEALAPELKNQTSDPTNP